MSEIKAGPNKVIEDGRTAVSHVVHLVKAGFAVHWLKPRQKAPLESAWTTAAVSSVADLQASYKPGANVGVRLGEPSKIGDEYLHVLDVDVRDPALVDEARAALLRILPDVDRLPSVISGSGGASRHHYLTADRPFTSKKLAHSATQIESADGKSHWAWEIELYGTGKQVVLPPSIHPNGRRYQWERKPDFDAWDLGVTPHINSTLIETWSPDLTRTTATSEDDDFAAEVAATPKALTRAEIDATLAALPVAYWRDDRNGWLTVGAALHHQFRGAVEGLGIWTAFSCSSAKFDEKDQRRTWDTFKDRPRPTTMATLLKAAREASEAPVDRGDLTFLSPSECEAAPSRGYVWKGFIASGDVACVFGAPGGGKSLLAPYLGYRVAQGLPAFGGRTRAGPVFYVAAEDAHGMQGRVRALKRAYGDAVDFTLVGGVSDLFAVDSPDLAKLLAAAVDRRPVLIIVDTVAMAFPGLEENDARSMNVVVTVGKRLAETGAAVLLVHHDTKAAGSKGGAATPRGHSALNAALYMSMHLEPVDGGIIRGRMKKNRNGSCAADVAFRIAVQDFGLDDDGDAIRLPFAEEVSAALASPAYPKLAPHERKALDILRGAGGEMILESWLMMCAQPGALSTSSDPKSRRRAATRARDDLAELNLIRITGERVGLYSVGDLEQAFDDEPNGFDEPASPALH